MNDQGEHDFTKPDGSAWNENDHVGFGLGLYSELRENPQYRAKKEADRVSYVWDKLITLFTDHMLAGTTLVPDGQGLRLSDLELGVRQMALLPRFARRSFGTGILDVLEKSSEHDRYMRAFLTNEALPWSRSGFFFLTLKVPDHELEGGYAQYRQARRTLLETYALHLLKTNPQLDRIVGVATEPRNELGGRHGSSEDLIYVEPGEWTEEFVTELEERKRALDIGLPENIRTTALHDQEFPEIAPANDQHNVRQNGNRRQRRASAALERRRHRKKR